MIDLRQRMIADIADGLCFGEAYGKIYLYVCFEGDMTTVGQWDKDAYIGAHSSELFEHVISEVADRGDDELDSVFGEILAALWEFWVTKGER